MQTILYFGSIKEGRQLKHEQKIGHKKTRSAKIGLVVISGLEPPTHGFSVRCSTN